MKIIAGFHCPLQNILKVVVFDLKVKYRIEVGENTIFFVTSDQIEFEQRVKEEQQEQEEIDTLKENLLNNLVKLKLRIIRKYDLLLFNSFIERLISMPFISGSS